MDFKVFYQRLSPEQREEFARAIGSTVGYCHQIAYGNKRVELGLADAMVAASKGELSLDSLPLTARSIYQREVRSTYSTPKSRKASA